MASTKPASTKTTPAAPAKPGPKGGKAAAPPKPGPVAGVASLSAAGREPLAAAAGMPGWRGARTVLGEGLAAGATGLLLEARGQAVALRRRVGAVWQPAAALAGGDAAAAFAALRSLAAPATAGRDEPEYVVTARGLPRRPCRVAARAGAKGEQLLVLLGPELPAPERPTVGGVLAAAFGRLVPSFLRRTPPPPERDPSLPRVELRTTGPDAAARQESAAAGDGFVSACDLVAAAVRDRAGAIVFEAGPQGVAVRFDVDGVPAPVPTLAPALALDKAGVAAVVGAIKTVAGHDPKSRNAQTGRITALVEGKPWACTAVARRTSSGERLEVVIDHVRPKFKTLEAAGIPATVVDRVQEFLKLESGLILLVAPRAGGLSTLFDVVIGAADRLLRDFVLLEDAADPRPEIQNVKPVRWDSRAAGRPEAALEAALREYPNVLATCDLEDAELARRLVAQAGEGRLVIVGIRGADAAEGIARLAALGGDAQLVSRVLLGAVGVQLVRKLCPKCRREYFPAAEAVAKLKLDPDADVTLFRAAAAGCPVCTGTGHLGRTVACELAAGPTLRAAVAAGGDAKALRQAAVRDGMVPLLRDAVARAARGETSIEEVQRVFRRA